MQFSPTSYHEIFWNFLLFLIHNIFDICLRYPLSNKSNIISNVTSIRIRVWIRSTYNVVNHMMSTMLLCRILCTNVSSKDRSIIIRNPVCLCCYSPARYICIISTRNSLHAGIGVFTVIGLYLIWACTARILMNLSWREQLLSISEIKLYSEGAEIQTTDRQTCALAVICLIKHFWGYVITFSTEDMSAAFNRPSAMMAPIMRWKCNRPKVTSQLGRAIA
jgi:hypothetical protein